MYRQLLITPLLILTLLQGCSTLETDPTAEWSAKDFYDEASEAIDAGEFQSAIKHLETLEARFPFDPYAKQAQLDIAYAYYKFEEPESAISALNRFMRLHPRDPNIDYAYYIKGLANFHRGEGFLDKWFTRDPSLHDAEVLHNAFNDFSTLVRRFPDSRYAGDAHQRMVYLRNKLAQKEINVAEYYLERGVWIAAANRAKEVIETFQDSSWSRRALEIMIKAYTELGLKDLASDTQRVLELNRQTYQPSTPIQFDELDEYEEAKDTPPEISKS